MVSFYLNMIIIINFNFAYFKVLSRCSHPRCRSFNTRSLGDISYSYSRVFNRENGRADLNPIRRYDWSENCTWREWWFIGDALSILKDVKERMSILHNCWPLLRLTTTTAWIMKSILFREQNRTTQRYCTKGKSSNMDVDLERLR